MISLKELGFFNSGQAVLLPGAAAKIERIAQVLTQHGLDLRVEGHSDNQPIHNAQFRSNWELSTARAMAVVQLLVDDAGFDPRKISVAGYGQYRPIADDATPEGRRMNRRVDLVVVAADHPSRIRRPIVVMWEWRAFAVSLSRCPAFFFHGTKVATASNTKDS